MGHAPSWGVRGARGGRWGGGGEVGGRGVREHRRLDAREVCKERGLLGGEGGAEGGKVGEEVEG